MSMDDFEIDEYGFTMTERWEICAEYESDFVRPLEEMAAAVEEARGTRRLRRNRYVAPAADRLEDELNRIWRHPLWSEYGGEPVDLAHIEKLHEELARRVSVASSALEDVRLAMVQVAATNPDRFIVPIRPAVRPPGRALRAHPDQALAPPAAVQAPDVPAAA